MAANQGNQFIDGIFNYCDRWCERCPQTAHCRLFAMEREMTERVEAGLERRDPLDPNVADDSWDDDESWDGESWDDEPWDDEPWVDSEDLTDPSAESTADPEVGETSSQLDLDDDNDEGDSWTPGDSDVDEFESAYQRARQDELAKQAMAYGMAVFRWLQREEGRLDASTSAALDEASRIIGWYGPQLGAKLTRALGSLYECEAAQAFDSGSGWVDEDDQALLDGARHDMNGSAKVALIGIERSIGAWTTVRDECPDLEAVALDSLQQLGSMRREVDRRFPDARTFIRPGFDD